MKPATLAKYFTFLDRLRESGITNMYGSGPYLEKSFNLSREKATPVVREWMKTFSLEKTPAERAKLSSLTNGQQSND